MTFLGKTLKQTLRNSKKFIKRTLVINSIVRNIYNMVPSELKLWFSRVSENPYKEMEDDNKVIFVHIPKAAGNGIKKSLFGQTISPGHYFAVHYKKEDSQKFNSYYKFTIVRNPWDRLVSAYFFLKQGGKCAADYEFSQRYLKDFESFRCFVLKLKDTNFQKRMMRWMHFIPQYKFVFDENDKLAVDYLGKFESIEEDFNYLKNKLQKQSAVLKKENQSKHKPYWEYYDEEMVEIVGEIYREDVERFKYSFPLEKLKKQKENL
ncbi:sulfotransferase family 2 domain-containing protein [Bacillus songklensis]|uniref:Sulfotransferase family 2 domain-containing protein n=1 Tax=Bacillus songklensis TaxID=1069116 RepID=A0ABV8AZV9_9BACI